VKTGVPQMNNFEKFLEQERQATASTGVAAAIAATIIFCVAAVVLFLNYEQIQESLNLSSNDFLWIVLSAISCTIFAFLWFGAEEAVEVFFLFAGATIAVLLVLTFFDIPGFETTDSNSLAVTSTDHTVNVRHADNANFANETTVESTASNCNCNCTIEEDITSDEQDTSETKNEHLAPDHTHKYDSESSQLSRAFATSS
jgi:hypothetical protein